jgi:hypothetical protein
VVMRLEKNDSTHKAAKNTSLWVLIGLVFSGTLVCLVGASQTNKDHLSENELHRWIESIKLLKTIQSLVWESLDVVLLLGGCFNNLDSPVHVHHIQSVATHLVLSIGILERI